MFTKILLASDGSEHALRAALKAANIAKGNLGSIITIVYVIDGTSSKSDVLTEGTKEAIHEKRLRKLLPTEELLTKHNLLYKIEFLKGEPGPSIVKYANEHDYELVVVGSRGLNGLQEMVLGSVSHKVAKRVKCPVMIVK